MIEKNEGWVTHMLEGAGVLHPPPDGVLHEVVYAQVPGMDWQLLFAALGVLLATIPVWAWLWRARPGRKVKDPRKGVQGRTELGAIGRGSERGRPGQGKKDIGETVQLAEVQAPTKGQLVVGEPIMLSADGRSYETVERCGDVDVTRTLEIKHGPPVAVKDSQGLDAHDRKLALHLAHEQIKALSDEVVVAGGGWPKTLDDLYMIAMQRLLAKRQSLELTWKQQAESMAYVKAMQQDKTSHAPFGVTEDGYQWEGK